MVRCDKRRYHTREDAEMALLVMRIRRELHSSNRRKEYRVYYHKPCKAWHTTSMPIGEYGAREMQEKSERKESPGGISSAH